MDLKELGNPQFIALETFRKSGVGVSTPVWVTPENGKYYVWTGGESGKVKRIRNNPRVRVAVSDARGTPKGDWAEAQARILDSPQEIAVQKRRMAAKYGLQWHLLILMAKLRRGPSTNVVLEISGPN